MVAVLTLVHQSARNREEYLVDYTVSRMPKIVDFAAISKRVFFQRTTTAVPAALS